MSDQQSAADVEIVDIGEVCWCDGAQWFDYFAACIVDENVDCRFAACSLEPFIYGRRNVFNRLRASKIGLDTEYSRFVRKRCYAVLETCGSWIGTRRGVDDDYLVC